MIKRPARLHRIFFILALAATAAPASAVGLFCTDHFLRIRREANCSQIENDRFEHELKITGALSLHALTIETLGSRADQRVRVQLVRHRGRDAEIETFLRQFMTSLPGRFEDQSNGVHVRGVLTFVDELEFRVHLARAQEVLPAAIPDLVTSGSWLGETPERYNEASIARLVAAFVGLHRKKMPSPAGLSDARANFLRQLTAREQTFFDWAIFTEALGYRSRERAQRAEDYWRTLDPRGTRPWAKVHADLRRKLLAQLRAMPAG